ncbi:hypothetical protein BAUCODRAFT_61455 [Baudoinia panamericana UAMH 10762]|uniref:Inner centromere protein ARK-binding domain-containing protein n=1 Tax=Baudoinia panamericana (strain UAMH 10762) TaxID=717646 RepID=M2NQ49_BAUPA|nr:uncharacterized protein BAUCODRAFT_61455 [Baudoinia panamericana UAMH 10762]EMD01146.1 hypothetical protein BAUCODRAFT_61455 [Baudoinia panamericana UAMH 10762]
MASTKTRAAPVGSWQWIADEREQAAQFIEQDVEEFSFSVRNELEWLNEHMAEVFSNGSVNFADIFKTPGKLRGRTPRTARKRDALVPRRPLTDIFGPGTEVAPLSAQRPNAFLENVAQFAIAEDAEDAAPQRPMSRSKSPQRVGKPGNTDSGYHGMTEDEMEGDAKTETATTSSQEAEGEKVPLRDDQPRPVPIRQDTAEGGQTSDESFTSAKEDQESRHASKEALREVQVLEDDATFSEEAALDVNAGVATTAVLAGTSIEAVMVAEDVADDTPMSPSDGVSTPEKLLQRKSSFTFSALPAREPLNAKHSFGARNSQVDTIRNSVLAHSFGARQVEPEAEDDVYTAEKPEESKAYSKTSTQLLHERITMLGKMKEPRTSKSMAQSTVSGQATYPKLPNASAEPAQREGAANLGNLEQDVHMVDADNDDDDWIVPAKSSRNEHVAPVINAAQTFPQREGSPARPSLHQKSISSTNILSSTRPAMPIGHQKSQSVTNPSLANAVGAVFSTTPFGSPMAKKQHDGPLSASKNKLWSALKSAKSIFASSASASAAAKLEAHNSPSVVRSPQRGMSGESRTKAVFNMPGALYSEQQLPPSPVRPVSVVSASPSRKTRSSNESDKKREKEVKAQQKAADELEKAREKERQKAAKQQDERRQAEEAEAARVEQETEHAERPVSAQSDQGDMPPPPPPKSMLPAGKLRAPGRLMRPTRAEPNAKPAPVSIRVASQSQRLGQGAPGALSKSQHEGTAMAPPPPPKTGLRTASAQGSVRSSTAPNNARLKVLEAAARKKEADERAAAKKLEQKRELERKRAAKAEEERRIEEEKRAAEQARIHEAKLAAQRKAEQQAAEARRREQQRLEQQRVQEEAQKAKAAHELAEAIKRERAQQTAAHPRGDVGGTLRQLAKSTMADLSFAKPALQMNPAKPAKRVLQEDEEPQHAAPPQRPGLQRGPASFQQDGAKRRRTDEEQEQDAPRHSVMAPPKRPSVLQKVSCKDRQNHTAHKFPHGYAHAPPAATHHTNNMFKSTVTAQHQLQHAGKPAPSHPSQTVQMSNARIPFAENANPPTAQYAAYQQTHPGYENLVPGAAASKFKTPARPAQAQKSAKSSPMYPNGDSIQLPEILTDSEEEDSEDDASGGFRAPSWVASPALRELLTQQQLVDPETVFGPIAELKMEEVFKGGKNQDRLKKFRDRGSSAAWIESGDAVTSAEKRRDMELRERVVREGGWRYEPSH